VFQFRGDGPIGINSWPDWLHCVPRVRVVDAEENGAMLG